MDEDLEAIVARFEHEFCPPISPELLRAILSDYDDLDDPTQAQSARAVLDSIRHDALADDARHFDPSGTSGAIAYPPSSGDAGLSAEMESLGLGDLSGLTSSASYSGVEGSGSSDTGPMSGALGECELADEMLGAGEDAKVRRLQEMFHGVKERDVRFQLQKADGDFSRATDALLNLVYFAGEQEGPEGPKFRGVEAFAEENGNVTGKRRKQKKKKRPLNLAGTTSDEAFDYEEPENRWKTGQTQISFIAERTTYSSQAVSSLWYKSGQTVRATLLEMIRVDLKENDEGLPEDETMLASTLSLKDDFPALDSSTCAALTRLSSDSSIPSASHDLAMALLRVSHVESRGPIVPKYAPLELDQEDVTSTSNPFANPRASSASVHTLATQHRQHAESAQRYYRISRSKPEYGGAAAHYAAEARKLRDDMRDAQRAAADALAAGNASEAHVDLHQIDRANALRIALERVEAWWRRTREEEPGYGASRARCEGFTVVFGRGIHSANRKSVLGPAVVKALMREGWKVTVDVGSVTVTGRERNPAR